MKPTCRIYRAWNPYNGKSYVGFTKNTMERRRLQHLYGRKRAQTVFGSVLRKWHEHLVWEILFESWDEKFCLEIAEPALIERFDAYVDGYNSTLGGDGGRGLIGPENGMFGRTHTQEVRNKLRLANIGRHKGRSYEERYGVERAASLRAHRRSTSGHLKRNKSGTTNPYYDATVYVFHHIDGRRFTGTQTAFREQHDLKKSSVSSLLSGTAKTYKGWKFSGAATSIRRLTF